MVNSQSTVTTFVFSRVRNSLISSLLIHSFAQVDQDKWATVSESLSSLMTNEQMWAICSGRSGQMSKLLFFLANLSFSRSLTKKWVIRSKKFKQNLNFWTFLHFFKSFFYKQKICSFLLSTELSERNKRPGGIRSGCSEGMSNLEQIAQVAHQNEQMSKLLTFWASCSFAHFFGKKRVICSKIWWANSFQ